MTKKPTTAERIAELKEQMKVVEAEASIHRSKRGMAHHAYQVADRHCGELEKQATRLKKELKGLKINVEVGNLYKVRCNWTKDYILITSVRRPRKYTHVKGLYVSVDNNRGGDLCWSKTSVKRFDSDYAHMQRGIDEVSKMTFLTTEGFDIDTALDFFEQVAPDKVKKVVSSVGFEALSSRSWRSHNNHHDLKEYIASLDSGTVKGETN